MDFVDDKVDVQIIRIVVNDSDLLVLTVSERFGRRRRDLAKAFPVRSFAIGEGQ